MRSLFLFFILTKMREMLRVLAFLSCLVPLLILV